MIPAVAAAKTDHARGELSDDDVIALAAAFGDVVSDLPESEAEGVAQSGAVRPVRYLGKRLRQRLPAVRIVVAASAPRVLTTSAWQ